MKGDPKVIEALSDVLTAELTAINQYFLHARMCMDWGFTKIGKFVHDESIEEMKHAQELIDRILFLEGHPNLQKLGKLHIGENVEEQLKSDLKLEYDAVARLRDAIEVCTEVKDFTTRDLFEKILIDEEKHVDWIEAQMHIIKQIGIKAYLAEQFEPGA
jgi:bacterioferritin